MKQRITPCLWFDDEAEEAAKFYTSIFTNSKITQVSKYNEEMAKAADRPKESVMIVKFELNSQEFIGLNGGPIFKLNPSISMFVHCETKEQVDTLFKKLSQGGQVMMELDKYPFSERYVFIADKYGLSWQIMLSKEKHHIEPAILFVKKSFGKAEEAIKYYIKVFKNSKVNHIEKYKKGQDVKEGTVMYSSFVLEGEHFSAMDGPGTHEFGFNEAFSFTVNCKGQEETDYYYDKLAKDGSEQPCGWVKDKFGISWQINPIEFTEMVSDKNPKKVQATLKAMLQMKKLDLKKFREAFDKG